MVTKIACKTGVLNYHGRLELPIVFKLRPTDSITGTEQL